MFVKKTAMIVLFLVSTFAASAHAEISQEDQERAAQSAYQNAADENNEVADKAQQYEDAAEAVRDTAEEILEILSDDGE